MTSKKDISGCFSISIHSRTIMRVFHTFREQNGYLLNS